VNTTKEYNILSQLSVDVGWDPDIVLEYYSDNYGKSKNAICEILASFNSSFGRLNKAESDEFMRVLEAVHEQKAKNRSQRIPKTNKGDQATEKGIQVPDLFFVDIKGREHIDWTILREFVQEKLIFKTVRDTDELLVYKKGIYVDAKKTIRDFIHGIEGINDSASIRIIRELTEHIKARTGVDREIFNADKKYLPLKNGLFNFETQELENFDSEKCYTFRLPVKYDSTATHDATDRFMDQVVDSGDLDLMQEVMGYCLYPGFPSHHFYWLYGNGRNGKGVYSALLSAMIGTENTASVSLIELDGHHRFAAARLRGKLINIVPESYTQNGIETNVLKAMTGMDIIGGETKGVQELVNFVNFAKFIVHSNEFPRIDDTSDSFWDRAIPVPFPNQFKGEKATKNLFEDIIAEDTIAGIFNYALKGLNRLRDNDWEFTPSKTQTALKADMRRMAQPVKTFQEQWTELNNRAAVTVDKLYDAMQKYCDEFGITPLEKRDFVREIKNIIGVVQKIYQNHEGYREHVFMGIKLKKTVEAHLAVDALAEQNESKTQATEEDTLVFRDTPEALKI
jgi:putative DNA primase/helicase